MCYASECLERLATLVAELAALKPRVRVAAANDVPAVHMVDTSRRATSIG